MSFKEFQDDIDCDIRNLINALSENIELYIRLSWELDAFNNSLVDSQPISVDDITLQNVDSASSFLSDNTDVEDVDVSAIFRDIEDGNVETKSILAGLPSEDLIIADSETILDSSSITGFEYSVDALTSDTVDVDLDIDAADVDLDIDAADVDLDIDAADGFFGFFLSIGLWYFKRKIPFLIRFIITAILIAIAGYSAIQSTSAPEIRSYAVIILVFLAAIAFVPLVASSIYLIYEKVNSTKTEVDVEKSDSSVELLSLDKAIALLKRPELREYICPHLTYLSNDVFDISKRITPVIVGMVVVGAIRIPINSLLLSSMALIVSRTSINAFCLGTQINCNESLLAIATQIAEQGFSKYDLRGAQFDGGFAETVQGDQIGKLREEYQRNNQQFILELAEHIQIILKKLDSLEIKIDILDREFFVAAAIPLDIKKNVVSCIERVDQQSIQRVLDSEYGESIMSIINSFE